MDYYAILDIPPTSDQREIKRAYARQLKIHSPETDPEGFRKIRDAYEQAIAILDKNMATNSTSEAANPVEEFMTQFKAYYNDYNVRLNIDVWKELLQSEVCEHIDTKEEISQGILSFLTDYYYLPHEVWSLFNKHFAWDMKKDKLSAHFHSNFIEFVMSKALKNDFFRYAQLLPYENGQQDVFIGCYYNGIRALDTYDYYSAFTAIDEAKTICADHPDLLILSARYAMEKGRLEHAHDILTTLIEKDNGDFYAHYYRAILLYRMGKFAEAVQDYEKIVKVRPDMVDVLFSLGKCGVAIGEYDKAIEYLNKLRKILPNDYEVNNLLSAAYRFQINQLLALRADQPEDTEVTYKLAFAYYETNQLDESYELSCKLEQTDKSAIIYNLMCQTLIKMNKKELAHVTLNKALVDYPDNYELNLYKANMLDELGNVEEAIEYYDRAISIKPSEAVTYNNKAYSLNRLEQYNEALVCASKAVTLDPNMPNGYRNKAEALLGLERYEECYEACEEALQLFQHYVDAYNTKMRMLTRVGQYDSALSVYNVAYDLGLKDSMLHCSRAEALRLSGNNEEAIRSCELALELDDNHSDSLYCKGLCHYNIDQYDEAIHCFDKVIENIGSENALYYKALSCYYSSREDEAITISEQAIAQEISHKDRFHGIIGDVYRGREMTAEAIIEYKKAIESDPSVAVYYYYIGNLLADHITYQESLSYLDQAIELDPTLFKAYDTKIHAVFFYGKDYEKCLELCNQVLDIEPGHVNAIDFKAWSLNALDRMQEAQATIQVGLLLDGNYISLLHLKMIILKEEGHIKESLVVCDRILELEPTHQDTLEKQAEMLRALKRTSLWKWF
jgi:tetratricopeptide (TPR) repeat protein